MGLFRDKKQVKQTITKPVISEDSKICELFTGDKNKFGTYVLSPKWLCKNGCYYQINNEGDRFTIDNILWDGENIISDIISSTSTETLGKSKKTGRVLGAIVGSVVAPGLGTVVGAMHGTGNTTTKQGSVSQTNTYERAREVVSDIVLEIKNEYGERNKLCFRCYSKTAKILTSLLGSNNETVSSNPYDELKKLKGLLDIGAITQEEYDIKKKQLLNL